MKKALLQTCSVRVPRCAFYMPRLTDTRDGQRTSRLATPRSQTRSHFMHTGTTSPDELHSSPYGTKLEQIFLPNTREGRKVYEKAMALWRAEAERAAGSDDNTAFMNRTREEKPSLLLFVDPASTSATFCLDRILFQPNHPLISALLEASRSRFRWTKRLAYVAVFIFPTLSVVYYVYREQVPISGRWRFNFHPKSTLQSTSSDWTTVLEELEILPTQILPKDHPATIFAKAVFQRLLPVSGLEHLDWEVQVVNDLDTVTAIVTPDGKVLVYTGLLYRCECEDDLAVILGHEIAHVVAAHRDEVRSLFILFNIATAPIAILFWPLLALEYFDWDIGPLEYVLLPYSFAYTMAVSHIERACESEADYIGLVIMSYVGYDIRRAPDFFQTAVLDYDQLHRFYLHEFRLLDEGLLDEDEDEDNDKDGGGDRDDKEQESESVVNKVRERLSKLTSSHPPNELRIQQMQQWIPEILQLTGHVAPPKS